MTLTTTVSADIRARASFLPMCPMCSFPSVNILVRPGLRVVTFPTTHDFPEGRTVTKLDPCCMFSTPAHNYFESEAAVAQWWRAHRLQALAEPALDNRRRNCIAKLEIAGLEPIV